MSIGQPIVWEPATYHPPTPWLWGRWVDTLWIAGGASYLLAVLGVPATLLWASFGPTLIATLLHLGTLVNYPHYAATYALAVRERNNLPRGYRWLLFSTPVMIALAAAAVRWPEVLVLPLVRVYLTWSAYHYSAQHYGIASMYSAKSGQPLLPREKRFLRWSFIAVALYMMIAFNMMSGTTIAGAPLSYRSLQPMVPREVYPLALLLLVVAIGAFAGANHLVRGRTGRSLTTAVWLLALTNGLWFVVPNIWLPGAKEPWLGEPLALWVPVAIPFFHCAQYLAVAAARARAHAPMRPVIWMAALVAVGLLLFEGTMWTLPRLTLLGPIEAVLIVTSLVNIHHFVLDGIVWKRPQAAKVAA